VSGPRGPLCDTMLPTLMLVAVTPTSDAVLAVAAERGWDRPATVVDEPAGAPLAAVALCPAGGPPEPDDVNPTAPVGGPGATPPGEASTSPVPPVSAAVASRA